MGPLAACSGVTDDVTVEWFERSKEWLKIDSFGSIMEWLKIEWLGSIMEWLKRVVGSRMDWLLWIGG